ncbi:MAG: tetraacyldisaccharide 4'-kinase [Pseudomonadota bacterium]
MMDEPWFWREDSAAAGAIRAVLSPLSRAYAAGARLRADFTKPQRAPAPVLCVGGASLGGAGKTPFCLMLADLLSEKLSQIAFLTRGYGGASAGPLRADAEKHTFRDVGDEALLLAKKKPTWVARNRVAGARAASAAGADLIIMDDGFQNPTLVKDFSILLADRETIAGAGAVFPAGRLREPFSEARNRADYIVCVESSSLSAADGDADDQAWLELDLSDAPKRAIAFCGIARPERFFTGLRDGGVELIATSAYRDHAVFSQAQVQALLKAAADQDAGLITTEKDLVRIDPGLRSKIFAIRAQMRLHQPEKLLSAIEARLSQHDAG